MITIKLSVCLIHQCRACESGFITLVGNTIEEFPWQNMIKELSDETNQYIVHKFLNLKEEASVVMCNITMWETVNSGNDACVFHLAKPVVREIDYISTLEYLITQLRENIQYHVKLQKKAEKHD